MFIEIANAKEVLAEIEQDDFIYAEIIKKSEIVFYNGEIKKNEIIFYDNDIINHASPKCERSERVLIIRVRGLKIHIFDEDVTMMFKKRFEK